MMQQTKGRRLISQNERDILGRLIKDNNFTFYLLETK